MKNIFQKFCTACAALLIMAIVSTLIGFLVAYLSEHTSPGLAGAVVGSANGIGSDKVDSAFAIVYALFFGMTNIFLFFLLTLAAARLQSAKEMRRELMTAAGITLLSFLVTTCFIMLYVTIFAGKFAIFEIIVGKMMPAIHQPDLRPGAYLAHAAFIGLITGFILATLNVIRFFRTQLTLPDYLLNGNSTLAKFISLLYPFNGLKFVFFIAAIISIGWQFLLVTKDSYLRLLIFTYGSASWGIASGYLYEFIQTKRGKNSKFMTNFYREISDEIVVLFAYSLCIFAFYCYLPKPYSLANFDLGLLNLPSLLFVLLILYRCGKTKVAGHKFSRPLVITLLGFTAAIYIGTFYVFYRIQMENIPAVESLWWQITMFATSISIFIGAKLLFFYLKNEHLEGSPIWLNAIRTLKFASGFYENVVAATPAWNEHVAKEKGRLRREKRQKKKK